MKANVCSLDKIVRIVLGVVLLSLFLMLDGSLRWLGLLGLVPLFTGIAGFCPLYSLLGISSCPLSRERA